MTLKWNFNFISQVEPLKSTLDCVLGVNMALKSDRWFAKLIL